MMGKVPSPRTVRLWADHLRERGVTVTGAPTGAPLHGFLSQLLSWLEPLFLFYLAWTFAFRHIAERQGLGGLLIHALPTGAAPGAGAWMRVGSRIVSGPRWNEVGQRINRRLLSTERPWRQYRTARTTGAVSYARNREGGIAEHPAHR